MTTELKKPFYKVYFDHQVHGCGPIGAPILAVGETPGNDECIFMEPFVGSAGTVLNNCLSRHGIPRESIRIDNLASYRPWENKFENILDTPMLAHGLTKIHEYIKTYRPIVVIALGNYPMYFLAGKGKKIKGKVIGIGNWRGSILPYVDDTGKVHEDIKVIPTYHPSAVNRERSLYPIFDTDIKRIAKESKSRGLNYTEREIIANPSGIDLSIEESNIAHSLLYTADIETIKNTTTILSISFSTDYNKAIVLSPDSPERIQSISRILASPARKVFHFGYFDTTQLKLNGFEIALDEDSIKYERPYFFDTYLACHVLEPELPKTLAFETSTRTREPYYKHEGKEDEGDRKGWSKKIDRDRLYRYNGKDTCTDYEVFFQQFEEILDSDKGTRDIFNFEMSSIELQTHISNSGMLLDPKRLELLKNAMIARWAKLQYPLDGLFGSEVNVKSPNLKDWLYSKEADGGLGLPTKYLDKRVTTNDAALVTNLAWCKKKMDESVRDETKKKYKYKLNILKTIREIREIRQRFNYLNSQYSSDGRSRSSYKFGPETGRYAATKWVDGSGYNHQTNPRDPVEVGDADFEKYKNEMNLLKLAESDIGISLNNEDEEDEDE